MTAPTAITPSDEIVTYTWRHRNLVTENRRQFFEDAVAWLPRTTKTLVVNFSQCGHIDWTGLGMLVSLNKRALDAGKEFKVSELSPELLAVFEKSKLDTIIAIIR